MLATVTAACFAGGEDEPTMRTINEIQADIDTADIDTLHELRGELKSHPDYAWNCAQTAIKAHATERAARSFFGNTIESDAADYAAAMAERSGRTGAEVLDCWILALEAAGGDLDREYLCECIDGRFDYR